jgi:hypothetical protein
MLGTHDGAGSRAAAGSRRGYDRRVVGSEGGHAPEDFFAGHPEGLACYRAVAEAVRGLGEVVVRVTKSQIAFRRRTGFAFVWRPGQYVRSEVPAVLSIALPYEVASGRFKEVAHPAPHVWMHHIELREAGEVDDEVRGWLREAYDAAG